MLLGVSTVENKVVEEIEVLGEVPAVFRVVVLGATHLSDVRKNLVFVLTWTVSDVVSASHEPQRQGS